MRHPLLTACQALRWVVVLWVSWWLLASPALAGSTGPVLPGAGATPSLAEALNPDGTLRAGVQGSFDARHFVLHTAPNGRPSFTPASTMGVGDENWQDNFRLPGTDGTVYAVLSVGSTVYIGGSFARVGGIKANGVAKWDGTQWSALGVGVSGVVNALCVSGTDVYVASSALSGSTSSISKWNGATWTSLGGSATSARSTPGIYTLAVAGTSLYAGGLFDNIGGVAANNIARWDGTGWNTLGTGTTNGASSQVRALAVLGGEVYVGGSFTTVGGMPANYLARWDGTNWNKVGTGADNGLNQSVLCLVAAGNDLYVGGIFTKAGAVAANSIAKWSSNTWSSFGTGTANGVSATGGVYSIAVSGTTVYVGGGFTYIADNTSAYGVAKWDGTKWNVMGTAQTPGVTANNFFVYVYGLALVGNRLYAGGTFVAAGDKATKYIASWEGADWNVVGANANGADNDIYAVAIAGTNVYVGGYFDAIGNVPANQVAKWDGTRWSALAETATYGVVNGVSGVNRSSKGTVYALAVSGSTLYVAGSFSYAGQVAANNIAKWDGTRWSAMGTGLTGSVLSNYASYVYALAVAGTTLYAGGTFGLAGGSSANGIAKWNGATWSGLGTGASNGTNSVVYALATAGTSVYVGGTFTTAGGQSANYIAQWNGTSWGTLGTGPTNGLSGSVYALAVSGTDLYVGGYFVTAGGLTANNMARWDGTAWNTLGAGAAGGVNNTVRAISVRGTNIYVGGFFTRAGGAPATRLAKWNGSTWSALGTGLNAEVRGLATGPGALLYAGGTFKAVGDESKVSYSFGVYNDVPLLATLTSINPTSAAVGSSVTLTGTNLAGATAVSFNGTAATTFTVVNSSTVTATVPPGATSGNVTVTTPNGTTGGLLFTVTYPDLVVDTPTAIPAGIYNSIIVTSTGAGTLAGDVTVNTSFTVQRGGTLSDGCAVIRGAGSFTLAEGATLSICAAQGIAANGASGTVQVTGTRSFSTDASYVYNGTVAQVTGDALPALVRNLTTTNAKDITLSQGVAIAQVLTIGDRGDLVQPSAAASVTLLSDATAGTALMVNRSSGTLQGATTTIQRAIDGSTNAGSGYRHFAPPVYSANVSGLTTTGFTPIVNSLYNTKGTSVQPFPTVYFYEESRVSDPGVPGSGFDKGWVSPDDLTDQLFHARGYTLQLPATVKLSVTGRVFDNGGVGNAVYRTGSDADAGWSLVGNPYPSPIDWRLVTASDREGLDAAMYIFQSTGPYTGSYRSYTNGIGGNPIIPLGQAFFVRVSSGQTQGIMFFMSRQRVTTFSTTSFKRTTADPRPQLALSLTGATLHDITYLYQETGATTGVDAEYDAVKMPNSNGLSVSQVATTTHLAINGLPTLTAATSVPLVVAVPAAGTYTLAPTTLSNLPAGLDAYLRDAQTGRTVKLAAGSSYSFDVTATQAATPVLGRFTLQFSPATPLATAPALAPELVGIYPNPTHGSFTVTVPAVAGATQVQAELVNTLGQVVRHQLAALPAGGTSFNVSTTELAAGVYMLRLQAGDTTLAKRLVVQ
jgi:hypothetical protein